MKKRKKPRFRTLAISLAAMMHLWLFTGFRPVERDGLAGVPVPPVTAYSARPSGAAVAVDEVRRVWSPVLFSLPSEMGFSRELLQEKPNTRLTFRQEDAPERFLPIEPAPRSHGPGVVPEQLAVTAKSRPTLAAPRMAPDEPERRPARRVFIDPDLKARLIGGIVLPPELNRTGSTAWEVHADISIARDGSVQHVFLEQPQAVPDLNLTVLRMLQGLQFRPDTRAAEGHIEIYSPRAAPTDGETP